MEVYTEAKEYMENVHKIKYNFDMYAVSKWLDYSKKQWKKANPEGFRIHGRAGAFPELELKVIQKIKDHFEATGEMMSGTQIIEYAKKSLSWWRLTQKRHPSYKKWKKHKNKTKRKHK